MTKKYCCSDESLVTKILFSEINKLHMSCYIGKSAGLVQQMQYDKLINWYCSFDDTIHCYYNQTNLHNNISMLLQRRNDKGCYIPVSYFNTR